jgi:hypothetical protein
MTYNYRFKDIDIKTEEVNLLYCGYGCKYRLRIVYGDTINLDDLIEVIRGGPGGHLIVVDIRKPQIGGLDKLIGGLLLRRRAELNYLHTNVANKGMEIKSYKESMEISKKEKEYKISKYKLQIEVGDDNNKDILVEDNIGRYFTNEKYLISPKVEKALLCMEEYIKSYIKETFEEIEVPDNFFSKPINSLAIELSGVIGERTKLSSIEIQSSVLYLDKIKVKYNISFDGNLKKQGEFDTYVLYNPYACRIRRIT